MVVEVGPKNPHGLTTSVTSNGFLSLDFPWCLLVLEILPMLWEMFFVYVQWVVDAGLIR